MPGTLNHPVRKKIKSEHEWAVRVDGDVGGDDADDVHGQAGLHHVARSYCRSLSKQWDYSIKKAREFQSSKKLLYSMKQSRFQRNSGTIQL